MTSEQLSSFIQNTIENNSSETATIIIMEQLQIEHESQVKKLNKSDVMLSLPSEDVLEEIMPTKFRQGEMRIQQLDKEKNLMRKEGARRVIQYLTERGNGA